MVQETLRRYHEETKHSPESVQRSSRGLDWGNRPDPLKRYLGIDPIPLPEPRSTGVPWHRALSLTSEHAARSPVDVDALSHLLFHAAGVTRTVRTLDGDLHFRTYASAGALYPIEVYVVAGEIEGLDAGVYHYAASRHGLTPLRPGDHRGNVPLAGERPGEATVVLTGIPWRTAWKYGPRGFRHLYWDAGMMLANLLAAAAARDVAAAVTLGFVDEAMHRLLGVDGSTEFALCAVPLGTAEAPAPRDVQPVDHRVEPVSARPELDPLIEAAHAATELASEGDVDRFRRSARDRGPAGDGGEREAHRVRPLAPSALSDDGLERVIRRRGSSRRQAREPFPASEYAAILDLALGEVPRDWSGPAPSAFVLANALEGLAQGAYRYRGGGAFDPIRDGDFRRKSAFMCLEQPLGGDAAAVTFLTADVEGALRSLGPRGYAAVQLRAAVAAGRMYMGAYGQCLGATGITFYDDEARRFFETEEEPMLSVVMGPEGERRSIVTCRAELTARRPGDDGR